ncbi:hypothetical protein QBC34DRAFT_430807 [Podospora aff. communis PSN243]|uniref:Fucose-specific lectin n=1 Tax=Podospora aff. communis PSN243 TaxID=3040156 RepID=A0AAV9G4C0_9PEZI|nr:hypothetical protein QBC34DRAFT_430807 [Podospora aff. communis PSN243]
MSKPREPSDLPEAVIIQYPIINDDNLPEIVPAERSKYDHLQVVAHSDCEHYPTPPKPSPEPSPQPPHPKILGLRRRTFIILATASTLILIAVAVALGVTLSQKQQNSQAIEPQPTPDRDSQNTIPPHLNTTIHPSSSLAATNYTDPTGTLHQYLFFQSPSRELLASHYNSTAAKWTTLSISALLAASGGVTFDILPATPIAAYTYTNPQFQTRLYFFTTGNLIREILTSDDPSITTNWRQGRLGGDRLITAAKGSKLAALRPHCGTSENCRRNFPWMAIAYQGEDGVVGVSRADGWEPMEVAIGPTRMGAPLGLASVMRGGDITDVRWSLFWEEGGGLREMGSEGLVKVWERGNSLGPVSTSSVVNLASFSYDLVNMAVITVDEKGAVGMRTWDTRKWSEVATPNLLAGKNAPTNPVFSAIAGNPQRRVYGIVDGVIHQWEFFSLSPLQWNYVGQVPTELSG